MSQYCGGVHPAATLIQINAETLRHAMFRAVRAAIVSSCPSLIDQTRYKLEFGISSSIDQSLMLALAGFTRLT
jgi:hypothetical protein